MTDVPGEHPHIIGAPVPAAQLAAWLNDVDYYEEALELYFEAVPVDGQAFAFEKRLRHDLITDFDSPTLPQIDGVAPQAVSDWFTEQQGRLENLIRNRRYWKDVRDGQIPMLVEGDSWTQHPLIKDLTQHLGEDDRFAVWGLGCATHLVEEMLQGDNIAPVMRAIRENRPRYMFLSGGGNDTIGETHMPTLLNAHPAPDGPFADRFINEHSVNEHLANLRGIYTELLGCYLDTADRESLDLRIALHGYDYAIPLPSGTTRHRRLDGPLREPWLSRSLDAVGAENDRERREIVRRLIDRFNDMLEELTQNPDFDGRVRYVDLRGTLRHSAADHFWYDEIHATSFGYFRLAQIVADAIVRWEREPTSLANPPRVAATAYSLPPVIVHSAAQTLMAAASCQERMYSRGTPSEQPTWAQNLLGLPQVWTQTRGKGIKVGILDTGIDESHSEFEGAIREYVDFTGQGREDVAGHGTHCAGIIGARQNGDNYIGVAPECDLYIAKVLGQQRSRGLDGEPINQTLGYPEVIAEGIQWAIAQDVDVLSISLGSATSTPEMYQAIHEALARGIIIVCAAGNHGALFRNSIGYPGRYGSVVCVGSHDRNGHPSGFSGRGGELDVLAPGDNIWSCWPGNTYRSLSGTSMATPFVAGLAALILSKHRNAEFNGTPIMNTEDFRQHLIGLATHPGAHDAESGYGALQPFAGIEPAM